MILSMLTCKFRFCLTVRLRDSKLKMTSEYSQRAIAKRGFDQILIDFFSKKQIVDRPIFDPIKKSKFLLISRFSQ